MRTHPLLQGLILGAGLFALWPATAEARPEYPGAMTDAASMACVPTCLLCHTTSPGTASTFTKPVALALIGTGKFMPGDEDTIQAGWDAIVAKAAADPNSDCSGVTCGAMVAAVPKGIEPKENVSVCGPTYGCGATVAQRPLADSQANRDPAAAVAGALAALAGIFAMRRRRR